MSETVTSGNLAELYWCLISSLPNNFPYWPSVEDWAVIKPPHNICQSIQTFSYDTRGTLALERGCTEFSVYNQKNTSFLVLLGLYNHLGTSGRQSDGTKNKPSHSNTTTQPKPLPEIYLNCNFPPLLIICYDTVFVTLQLKVQGSSFLLLLLYIQKIGGHKNYCLCPSAYGINLFVHIEIDFPHNFWLNIWVH